MSKNEFENNSDQMNMVKQDMSRSGGGGGGVIVIPILTLTKRKLFQTSSSTNTNSVRPNYLSNMSAMHN